MAAIDQGPPGPDESRAGLIVGVVTALHAVSFALFGTRIWTRVKPTFHLSVDDYFIILAVICDLVSYIFLLVAVHYGVGRHNYYVPDDKEMLDEKWLFISQPSFPWSLAFSKVSIAWMLIRIQRDVRWWVWTMYALIVISVGTAISSNYFQLTACDPLWAVWDHSNPDAKCTDPHVSQTSIYVNSALTIFTDFALSLAPLTFIVRIQRPLREKIALACVMGLGVFGSSASVAKTFMVGSYGKTGDTLMDTVGLTTLSMLEQQLAIIAACIPTLKRLFEKVLRQWGIISSQGSTSRSHGGYYKHDEYANGRSRSHGFSSHMDGHMMSNLRSQARDANKSPNTNIETDSLESGEMPIMKPSHQVSEASLRGGEYDGVDAPAAHDDNAVYFKTSVKGGNAQRGGLGSPGGYGPDGNGIQKHTVVSVRTEPKRAGRDGEIV